MFESAVNMVNLRLDSAGPRGWIMDKITATHRDASLRKRLFLLTQLSEFDDAHVSGRARARRFDLTRSRVG
jgi:hypothetical protein